MKIDLSSVDIFEDNELELDKKITFIFGKNGTGKSTITEEIKKLNSDYDVSVFQGFNNIIDENQLNLVIHKQILGKVTLDRFHQYKEKRIWDNFESRRIANLIDQKKKELIILVDQGKLSISDYHKILKK